MVTRRGEHEVRADAGYLCFARSRFAPPYFSRHLLNTTRLIPYCCYEREKEEEQKFERCRVSLRF